MVQAKICIKLIKLFMEKMPVCGQRLSFDWSIPSFIFIFFLTHPFSFAERTQSFDWPKPQRFTWRHSPPGPDFCDSKTRHRKSRRHFMVTRLILHFGVRRDGKVTYNHAQLCTSRHGHVARIYQKTAAKIWF